MRWRKKRNDSSPQAVATSELAGHGEDRAVASAHLSAQPGAQARGVFEAKNTDRLAGAEAARAPQFRLDMELASAVRSYAVPRRYKISGSLFSARPVAVYGELEGRQLAARIVTVMPGGILRGEVGVGALRVAGLFDGDLQAEKGVEVSSQGELRGAVTSPAIDVQAGARISGASLRIGGRCKQ